MHQHVTFLLALNQLNIDCGIFDICLSSSAQLSVRAGGISWSSLATMSRLVMCATASFHTELPDAQALISGSPWSHCTDGLKWLQGQTALMLACRQGHVDVVKLLIQAGADLAAKDHEVRHVALAL